MHLQARPYTYLAAGHPEGWNDAMRNNVFAFYQFIREGRRIGEHPCDFATFQDGHYLVRLVEAILESNASRRWIKV
jgi:predicted dehydrogenase